VSFKGAGEVTGLAHAVKEKQPRITIPRNSLINLIIFPSMKFTPSIGRFGGAGHVISVTKNTISGILFRNQRRFECGKVPNRVDRNRPKEQYYWLANRLPNLFELS
jgi:hypothetical protein